jgi:hypothetical protein
MGRTVTRVGRALAAALLAVLALTAVHGAASTAAPSTATAGGAASIGAAVVHQAVPVAAPDSDRDLPVPVPDQGASADLAARGPAIGQTEDHRMAEPSGSPPSRAPPSTRTSR